MKNNILLHDGQNNVIKGINKYLLKELSVLEDTNIIFNRTHGSLFSIYQQIKPEVIFLQVSEYTQETQDFIAEYNGQTKINLLVDVPIQNDQLNNFLNKTKVQIIKNKDITTSYVNTVASYGNMYDDEIFFCTNKDRNTKIVTILSKDNERNNILNEFIYPNTKYPIVVLNNPSFRSPVNLGLFNYFDLSMILNTFSGVIDIDGYFDLEAQACDINSYRCDDRESLLDALENNTFKQKQKDLSSFTYKNFVTQHLISHFRKIK